MESGKEILEKIRTLSEKIDEYREFIRLFGIVIEKKGIITRKELEEAFNEEKKNFDDLIKSVKDVGFDFDGKLFHKNGKEYSIEEISKMRSNEGTK